MHYSVKSAFYPSGEALVLGKRSVPCPTPKVSNAKFAKEDSVFWVACKIARVSPTARQASKYRNRKGAAYAVAR